VEVPQGKKMVTKVFDVQNTDGESIGVIQWNGNWRCYCFYPDDETMWSYDCLFEVTAFVFQLMKDREVKGGMKNVD
jgi:hypothetical protein